jgi:hypothetical protein
VIKVVCTVAHSRTITITVTTYTVNSSTNRNAGLERLAADLGLRKDRTERRRTDLLAKLAGSDCFSRPRSI